MNSFKAKRHNVLEGQLLKAAPEDIFPLLCPKREFSWIPDWKCKIIYSETGYAEPDCIFTTNLPSEGEEIWVVAKFEMNRKIQFIRTSKTRVIRYSINLTDNCNGTTCAFWEQTITALNEEGNLYVDNFDDKKFAASIKRLENQINHYVLTGEMLKSIP
ncbi:MAG: hypothetical protein R2757_05765 [Draconibacterium sp.]|jgi:hypothetical protein